MEIKWTYLLIFVLYGTVLAIQAINNKIKPEDQLEGSTAFYSYKVDFFTTVAISCIVVTLFINIAAILGGRPINIDSIVITILIVGLALLDGINKVYIKDEEMIHLCGTTFEQDEVKSIELKGNRKVNIAFTEQLEGYETVVLYLLNNEQATVHAVNNFLNQPPN